MADKNKKTLSAIQGESIDAITAQMADMSDIELAALSYLEAGSEKPRSTLIEAIENVQGDRAAVQADEYQAMLDKAVAEAGETAAARIAQLETENQDLVKKLAAATKTPAKPKTRKVKRQELTLSAKAGEPVEVVFTDRNDLVLPDLPALGFGGGAFMEDLRTGSYVLNAPVTFDGNGPAIEIAAAWTIDANGLGAGVSRLMQPVLVGGGRKAVMPARSLSFVPAAD